MYLARDHAGFRRHQHYFLRESYRDGGILYSRNLAALGTDPGAHIVYSSDTSFHIEENFLHRLRENGLAAPYAELEDLFFPFLDPYIRNRLEPFRHRQKYRNWRPMGEQMRKRAMDESHALDRRRLHFLRLGRASVETVDNASVLYAVLLDKSRDEIEQLILEQEQALPPREYQNYLFASFDLQRFFKESYARSIPQALNRQRLDSLFVEEVCRVAQDASFWQGYPRTDRLPGYLIRYLIMYFDAVVEEITDWSRFAQSRRSRRYQRTAYAETSRMSRSQAIVLFGLGSDGLANLDRKELTRLYRQKAQQLHPDKGGDAEAFIRLTAAYEELLASLP